MEILKYTEMADAFGEPIAVVQTETHAIFVAQTADKDYRVARVTKREYGADIASFDDTFDALQFVSAADVHRAMTLRECMNTITDQGWVDFATTPDTYREVWNWLAAKDLDLTYDEANQMFEQVTDFVEEQAEPHLGGETEEVRISDAYVGNNGTLMITGSRKAIDELMNTVTARYDAR